MTKSHFDSFDRRTLNGTISRVDAEKTPNRNLRVNRRFLLTEPEIRALNAIYKPDSDEGAVAYGEPIEKKIFTSLWAKGCVKTESSPCTPLLTEYGIERLKWSRNELDPDPVNVSFPQDPKVRDD